MKRKVKKVLKRANKSILLCIFLFLTLGIVVGYFSVTMLTKNDIFEIIGEKNITLNINEEYQEKGAKVISFGKDLNDKIEIKSNLDITKEGQYTIIYTVKSFRYKNIQRVRYITVTNGSDFNG